MHGKSATLASCEKRNTWKNQVANKFTSMDSRFLFWVSSSYKFIIPNNLQESQSSSPQKRTFAFFHCSWLFFPISCFGFNWDTHQNKQYNTIKNWHYIATTLLSNIAMRTHLSNKKYVICMDWAVGHPQTPSHGSEKTWPWSSVIPLPRVAHVVSNPSHQAPAKKWTNKNQTQVEIVRGWGELQL